MSRRKNLNQQPELTPSAREEAHSVEAKAAERAELERAGTAILEAAGPPLETIGEGMAGLTASIGERVGDPQLVVPVSATVSHQIPAGAVARKQRVRCKLAVEERIAVSTQLCERLTERDSVEEEKKSTAKEYSDTLAGLDAAILKLKNQFESGADDRELDCYDVRDILAKQIRTYRSDTGELVDERAMRPHELQLDLDEARRQAVADGRSADEIAAIENQIKEAAAQRDQQASQADMTEEQNLAANPEEAERMREQRLQQEAADRAAAGEPPAALLSMGAATDPAAPIADAAGSTTSLADPAAQ